jgi:hypothetical protein
MRFLPLGLFAVCAPLVIVQQLMAQQPIGRTSATEVKVSGAVDISHGQTLLGNGSQITAADQAVTITLERGGELHLCSTSSVHLSKDSSIPDPQSSALLLALDRGAIETHYTAGKYSDVLMTPDLRILISGPGEVQLSLRVNDKGDTCIDNHGASAPYVTVSSELEGGAYRILPNQRVSFQHGSLREVVDHEPEPCGCPVVPPVAVAGGPGDNNFPLAQSEGLVPTPKPAPVPPRETHAQVTVPLTYNGENPAAVPPAAQPATDAATPPAQPAQPESASTPPATNEPAHKTGFFHSLGHFFSHMFGG